MEKKKLYLLGVLTAFALSGSYFILSMDDVCKQALKAQLINPETAEFLDKAQSDHRIRYRVKAQSKLGNIVTEWQGCKMDHGKVAGYLDERAASLDNDIYAASLAFPDSTRRELDAEDDHRRLLERQKEIEAMPH